MAIELTWFGHATWRVRSENKTIVVDPFITENPACKTSMDQIGPVDLILVTHGHVDHIADAVAMANKYKASVACVYEIATWLQGKHHVADAVGMNLGGQKDFGFCRVKMTIAFHSSELPNGSYGGNPAGFVVSISGKQLYFAGDTALFGDMHLIGKMGIDAAILPIGDLYTMGPADSVEATKLISPAVVLPSHYNTWPTGWHRRRWLRVKRRFRYNQNYWGGILESTSMKIRSAIQLRAIFATSFFLGVFGASANAQTTPLRWKFAKSDQFEIAIEQTTKLETEADLVKQNIDTSSAVKFRWFVQELDAKGIAQIDMVVQSVQLKITMPVSNGVRTLEVDTAATPEAKPDVQETEMLQNLQAVLGKTIRLQVTDRGEIISVELDAATKESLRLAPQSMQIRQMLTDDGLRELFASGAPILPENEIKKGESWTVDKDFANPAGQFRREQKLTWLGNETHDNVSQENIDVTAQLSLLSPAPNSAKPSEVATKLAIKSQNTTGTIWFDSEKGMITQGSVASSLVTESRYRDKAIVTRISSQVELNVSRVK